MAKLNFENAIQQGYESLKKNRRYDISITHIRKLCSKPKFEALYDSFAFGFVQGMKAEKKNKLK